MAAYIRKHYKENKQYYLDKAKAKKEETKKLVRINKQKPCADCGIEYKPHIMQYDHLGKDDKLINLAHIHNKGWGEKKVLAEIAKCEVVCSNCHADRTFKRRNGLLV